MANTTIQTIEKTLHSWFKANTPTLSPEIRRVIKLWAPIVTLVVGALAVANAWTLWRWASRADTLLSLGYRNCTHWNGNNCGTPPHISLWIWLNVAFLVAEAVLCLRAYAALHDQTKQGWDYAFYAALLNAAYAVITLFTEYDRLEHFTSALLGSGIALYLLFQVRDCYTGDYKEKRQPPTATPLRKLRPRKKPDTSTEQ